MLDSIPDKHIEWSLLTEVISQENLYLAAQKALLNKLSRQRFFDYYQHLGINLYNLHKKLQSGTYQPSPTKEFDLWCISGQKMRHINVPTLDDLIVQHAIYRVLTRVIEPKLIFDSYGCRKFKGVTKAADRCQYFLRKCPKDSYYLQLDIKKYYYNIDHKIVKDILLHLTKDKDLVDFIALQFPTNQSVGMHVGTLLAQVMGIIYLNSLDHYIKRVLKCSMYIRYVDDFVIFGKTKEQCWDIKNKIEVFIKTRLNLVLSKFKISPISRGINFVGYKCWTHKRVIRKRSVRVFNRALKQVKIDSLQSCLGHALRTSSYSGMKTKVESLGFIVDNCSIHKQE